MAKTRWRRLYARVRETIKRTKHQSFLANALLLTLAVCAVYALFSYVSKFEVKLVERVAEDGAILVEYEYLEDSEEEKANRKRKANNDDYDSLDDIEQVQYNYRYKYAVERRRAGVQRLDAGGRASAAKHPDVTRICTMRERLDRVRRYCDRDKILDDTFEHKDLLVDERHRVVYCPISRAASTSWRTVFARASGKLAANVSWPPVHSKAFMRSLGLRFLADLARPEADRVAREYYMVLVVRHPYDRLVSAWRDRLVVRNSPSRWTLGTAILAEYRDAAHYEPSPEWNDTARFGEFARYLAANDLDDGAWNAHGDVCDVCAYRWSAVLRVETSLNDTRDVLARLGRHSGSLPFLHSHVGDARHVRRIQKRLPEMDGLPADVMDYLREKYAADFETLGYGWDPEENRTRCAIATANGECC